MRLTVRNRIGLVVAGAFTLLVGWFLWTVETEYSPLGFEIAINEEGVVEVWEHPTEFPDRAKGNSAALEAAGGTLVFSGTSYEAGAYIDSRHQDSSNYWLESLIIGIGAIALVLGIIPLRSPKREDQFLVHT